ncbi:hypothetical protein [Neptunicoccus cionae]|uniref:hypothetical protein n=1 Tax=Neptunicoccus cionae TaxID=2035344 RepID=UPI000C75876C|nr:hypothetical protein [Amylibacter cionae]PLS20733.1 hypothetical protein C0U40_13975 [Amylibacter cionae]
MAKKTTRKEKFYVVDLIRDRSGLKYIEIPKSRVDVEIEITTTGLLKKPKEAPTSVFDRLEKVGRAVFDDYEKIITAEAAKLDKKIDLLMQQPSGKGLKQAQEMTKTTNTMIKQAIAGAQGAADKAIADALKKEGQRDKLLKEARVKTGFKVTMGFVKIAGSVAKLVATSGADASSYKTIVTELYGLGKELQQQLKNEAKLRKDLLAGVKAMLDERGTAIDQAIQRSGLTDTNGIDVKNPKKALATLTAKLKATSAEVLGGKSPKEVLGAVVKFTQAKIKSKLADVEKARVAYRNHNTKTRHKTDSLSGSADKLTKAMKAAKGLKDGVAIGAKMMAVKRRVSAMAAKLEEREKFLDEMQEIMKSGGLEIDDKTTLQKLKQLDPSTILSEGQGLWDAIKEVKGMVDNVVDAVA